MIMIIIIIPCYACNCDIIYIYIYKLWYICTIACIAWHYYYHNFLFVAVHCYSCLFVTYVFSYLNFHILLFDAHALSVLSFLSMYCQVSIVFFRGTYYYNLFICRSLLWNHVNIIYIFCPIYYLHHYYSLLFVATCYSLTEC